MFLFLISQIEVVFTSNGESADMYVERLTEELKDAGCPNVMVIVDGGCCAEHSVVESIFKQWKRRSGTPHTAIGAPLCFALFHERKARPVKHAELVQNGLVVACFMR